MIGKDTRQSMTVHRGAPRRPAPPPRRTPVGRMPQEPMTFGQTNAVMLAAQTALCLLVVAGIFTLQFFSADRYRKVGDYFLAVMGRGDNPAVEVGIFDKPLSEETFREYFENAFVDIAWASEQLEMPVDTSPTGDKGMGGQNTWIPDNLYTGPVAFSAKAGSPAKGSISSPFGMRKHPITGADDFHTGIDIQGQLGDDVCAVLPGWVEEVGESPTYGNYVKLRHGKNMVTVYCHCDKILVAEKTVLRQGERIAEMGSTGISTGPHLHFEVRVNGDYVDPMRLLNQ